MFSRQERNGKQNANGYEGVIDAVLTPYQEWRVKVQGVYWHARTRIPRNFMPGDIVKIEGRYELKLWIAPL
ncbi:hypothetical protein [Leptothoe kymatousa]|uniref:NfeD-like C-terminal domain-containing protein n=1 Tax=Leptothoe kymatousa TAU-MAC 1615 TaxID=2364775 RepID=A0ABS5Y6S9_9CYAN|nr:hypothetical protein [Leptothoe kymatousa]MBT9313569.1 hypothetical protein [Leptothoe kymatousa TAU-MAC 1615]